MLETFLATVVAKTFLAVVVVFSHQEASLDAFYVAVDMKTLIPQSDSSRRIFCVQSRGVCGWMADLYCWLTYMPGPQGFQEEPSA